MSKQVKEQGSIPVSKVQRAAKFISTGAKVGGNYVKHYAKKMVNPSMNKDELHQNNASDIYNSLSELKGSALKVAQMMSMDKNLLPRAYQDKFTMAQYSAPPLSYPLVVKTFQKYFQQTPEQLFDTFTRSAVNAASIGQVHQAIKGGKTLAIKIQYPGIADSVSSDLRLVRPLRPRYPIRWWSRPFKSTSSKPLSSYLIPSPDLLSMPLPSVRYIKRPKEAEPWP